MGLVFGVTPFMGFKPVWLRGKDRFVFGWICAYVYVQWGE